MRYFSMFSGIGGFELGIGDRGECIGYSEIDKCAIAVYKQHFNTHKNYGDCTKIIATELPDFDLLVGGFPCQSFSVAGKRAGFQDTRGTLFFDVARIIKEKRPKNFLLENVKGLLFHNKGDTFATIISTLDELGYDVQWSVFNSKHYGVPQNRNRVYITGYLRGGPPPKIYNPLEKLQTITEEDRSRVCASTLTAKGAGRWGSCGANVVLTPDGFDTTDNKPEIPQKFRRYGVDGINPTLMTYPNIIVASRGRDGEQQLEPNVTGQTNTLTTVQKDNMVLEVTEGTIKGNVLAKEGDSIGLSFPNMGGSRRKIRRGRVGHGVASTLDTYCNQAVIQGATLRNLTPIECERLQGFPDGWTEYGNFSIGDSVWDGTTKTNAADQNAPHMIILKEDRVCKILDSARYKMCGNAVTTNTVKAVINQIL